MGGAVEKEKRQMQCEWGKRLDNDERPNQAITKVYGYNLLGEEEEVIEEEMGCYCGEHRHLTQLHSGYRSYCLTRVEFIVPMVVGETYEVFTYGSGDTYWYHVAGRWLLMTYVGTTSKGLHKFHPCPQKVKNEDTRMVAAGCFVKPSKLAERVRPVEG
jgi:hypothetical protein